MASTGTWQIETRNGSQNSPISKQRKESSQKQDGPKLQKEESLMFTIRTSKILHGKPLEREKEGRVCDDQFCSTILSVYNRSDSCWSHQPRKKPRIRGKLPSEEMEIEERAIRLCQSCGIRDADHPSAVKVDGFFHYAGNSGSATLCEN